MTPSNLLRAMLLITAVGAPLCLSTAHAKGKPDKGVAPVSTKDALKAQLKQNQAAIVQAGKDLVSAAQAILMLDDATLDLLEQDLEAAYDAAKDQFEALAAADQTDANLRALVVAQINAVWPLYTTDAGQLAALGTAAQAFADTVGPLEIAKLSLRAQLKALPKGKGSKGGTQ